jgi:hypothetical protein
VVPDHPPMEQMFCKLDGNILPAKLSNDSLFTLFRKNKLNDYSCLFYIFLTIFFITAVHLIKFQLISSVVDVSLPTDSYFCKQEFNILYYCSTGKVNNNLFSQWTNWYSWPNMLNNSVLSIVFVQYSIPMKQLTMVGLKAVFFCAKYTFFVFILWN